MEWQTQPSVIQPLMRLHTLRSKVILLALLFLLFSSIEKICVIVCLKLPCNSWPFIDSWTAVGQEGGTLIVTSIPGQLKVSSHGLRYSRATGCYSLPERVEIKWENCIRRTRNICQHQFTVKKRRTRSRILLGCWHQFCWEKGKAFAHLIFFNIKADSGSTVLELVAKACVYFIAWSHFSALRCMALSNIWCLSHPCKRDFSLGHFYSVFLCLSHLLLANKWDE